MAKATVKTYSKTEKQAILNEADDAVKKALAGVTKKYPGAIIGHTLSLTVPEAPITIEHSGNTRPLAAKDVTVPAPEALQQ